MRIEIQLPESRNPRTHISAKVAAEYVAHALGKLPNSAWPDMMRDGFIEGTVNAEFVGLVKFTVYADGV